MPHPAQIRDAVQAYIEQQYHPVRTWHIQDEIANRLDTRYALVYQALMQLETSKPQCCHNRGWPASSVPSRSVFMRAA